MFSPFKDASGAPKALADVVWDDLSQLKDADEGFALEFKRTYNAAVRRKLPKIIASFSNSHGGWLVVGIEDASKEVCPIERPLADFSQIIGELCRRHVSPTPRFELRFIADPAAEQQGVLVVRVDEGDFPPYVADGIVEVREGSTSGPAESSALVELYGKATRRRMEVAEFCRRTVWYPQGPGPKAGELPLFDLYLFHMGSRASDAASRGEVEKHVETMGLSFAQQGLDCHVQHAHDSIILRTTAASASGVPHSAIELFGDESMKLSVPAVLLGAGERAQAVSCLRGLGLAVGDDDLLISAPETLRRVTRMASLLDRYVRLRGMSWSEYAVAYELEGMAGVTLWSSHPTYAEYARTRGALFCGTTDGRSRVRYLNDGAHDSFRARQFAGSHFFEACGLPLGSADPLDTALVDALLSTR